jgi:hypothetical protein
LHVIRSSDEKFSTNRLYQEIEGRHRQCYEETVSGSLHAWPYGDYPRPVIYSFDLSTARSTPDAQHRDLCVAPFHATPRELDRA